MLLYTQLYVDKSVQAAGASSNFLELPDMVILHESLAL